MGGAEHLQPIDGPIAFQRVFGVSRETVDKLATYESLLKQWQKAVQLVAPSTLGGIWDRHFADSAQVLPLAPPEAQSWVDLGSGGGFPGLVVAILAAGMRDRATPLRMTLIESDTRKAAFLREVARQTGVTVDILGTRIESRSTRDKVGRVEVVSARALAPLTDLLALAQPFWLPATVGLFMKGRDVERDVESARLAWSFDAVLTQSQTDPAGRIVCVRSLNALAGETEN